MAQSWRVWRAARSSAANAGAGAGAACAYAYAHRIVVLVLLREVVLGALRETTTEASAQKRGTSTGSQRSTRSQLDRRQTACSAPSVGGGIAQYMRPRPAQPTACEPRKQREICPPCEGRTLVPARTLSNPIARYVLEYPFVLPRPSQGGFACAHLDLVPVGQRRDIAGLRRACRREESTGEDCRPQSRPLARYCAAPHTFSTQSELVGTGEPVGR